MSRAPKWPCGQVMVNERLACLVSPAGSCLHLLADDPGIKEAGVRSRGGAIPTPAPTQGF